MQRFLSAFLAISLIAPIPALAVDGQDMAVQTETQNSRLDKLFADLKRESNERAAKRLAIRIGEEWSRSGSAMADLLMLWSNEAIKAKKYHVALDFLDQVVVLFPDYAEGWNRRATVHFLMNDYARSMADISRTLELEPRHFGALSGMARMLSATGRKKQALSAYKRVLEIYPMLRNAQDELVEISSELAGQGV